MNGVLTLCENCGYEFSDKELNNLAVRRSNAVVCPNCGKVTYIYTVC